MLAKKKQQLSIFSHISLFITLCNLSTEKRKWIMQTKKPCMAMEDTCRIGSVNTQWKYAGRKPSHIEMKGKSHAACTWPWFHMEFSCHKPPLSFTGLCIRRERSNLKTLATTRKILRSAVYLCILPSLIQMFYNSHKKTQFGLFWLACSPICTCFSCFIVLKHDCKISKLQSIWARFCFSVATY